MAKGTPITAASPNRTSIASRIAASLVAALWLTALALTSPAGAAVTLDAAGTHFADNASVSADDYTGLTIGTGNALVCGIAWDKAVTSPTLTWDNGGTNQAMTLIKSATNTDQVSIYGLVGPTAGNKTMHAAWTNAATLQIICASFNGASQVGGTTTFYNSNSATGTSTTGSVTCNTIATGDMAIDEIGGGAVISAPTQTDVGGGGAGGSFVNNAMSRASGAGSNITFSWTLSSSVVWADVCTGIAQPAANIIHMLPLMGVGR